MPTLSASDYTRYLKLKTAATSYQSGRVPKSIQTTDQVVPVASILNAEVLASQAAYVVTPTLQVIGTNTRVAGRQVPQFRLNPDARATLSYAGTSGAMSSSVTQQPGGIPTGRPHQSAYTRLPQNAGWTTGAQLQR